MSSANRTRLSLQIIPAEVQVQMLSYLRAMDLLALQQSCKFYYDPDLTNSVVLFISEHVYTSELTTDILNRATAKNCTLEHLRNIELTVVARILSRPEPKSGFYVSKSWIKKTLLWLETINEPPRKKKLNKKQQRQRARRLSELSPPWPDANSDILCCHENLQRCGAKAARSRRRLMDKQAWKILKKLYPDSTQLESVSGECLQCLMETETARKSEQDRMEQEKLERKKPLSNFLVRRFYTRTRGVPSECLVADQSSDIANSLQATNCCPLTNGTYVIIPRGWCHQWRHYIKTGEGSMPVPPDSSALLCHTHKNPLLPPHLEAFLCGQTCQLLSTVRPDSVASHIAPASPSPIPVGVRPTIDLSSVNALMAAGFSRMELGTQQMAMLQLQQRGATPLTPHLESSSAASLNDMLDRQNHVVIELVTNHEWLALQEAGCWPKQLSHFAVSVTVQDSKFNFSTTPCRECDPSGSRFMACAEVKYRRKRWEPKALEQRRTPRVEY